MSFIPKRLCLSDSNVFLHVNTKKLEKNNTHLRHSMKFRLLYNTNINTAKFDLSVPEKPTPAPLVTKAVSSFISTTPFSVFSLGTFLIY